MESIINIVPDKFKPMVLILISLSPFITRGLYALYNGRGIRGTLAGIWFGTNQPKP
jgi:TM2 domain-containing membrane protein YozV